MTSWHSLAQNGIMRRLEPAGICYAAPHSTCASFCLYAPLHLGQMESTCLSCLMPRLKPAAIAGAEQESGIK
eukprot:75650-Pelagomonas_calceolata.AAC.2